VHGEEKMRKMSLVVLFICLYFPVHATEPDRPLRQVNDILPERFEQYRFPAESVISSIPGLEQALTQDYIEQYSSPRWLSWLNEIMRRGEPYLAFIRQEIEKRNMPPELVYLPVIESEYRTTAISKSGASGLWQFMQNSIAPFDMKVNNWIDERMDFWKSTIGALDKLQENYRILGDWPMALASYNAGMGSIQRVVAQNKSSDYWLLSERKLLSTETVHFVPKLLAVAYILSQPRRFESDFLWPESTEWVRILINRQVDLGIVAASAGIPLSTLTHANQELKYNVTPPDSQYHLKVPMPDSAAVSAILARTDLSLIKYYFYTIKSGDTLSALSLHYGVTVDTIIDTNPGTRERFLKIGARLLIPAYKDVDPYQGKPKPKVEPVVLNASGRAGTHLVKKGESLWSISKLYNTTQEALAELNGMRLNEILREGRLLKTP
jgi:membrane-bound lytic murein transglycosylase D